MASIQIDLNRVVAVLKEATGPKGAFSQRGLSAAAKEGRDCVGDLINGRNKNPTLKVLSALAGALGGDLSIFGIDQVVRADPPTESELAAALRDAVPHMPKRGSPDKRAEYLAEAVARVLRLPQARPETEGETDAPEEAAPPRVATS